MGQLETLLHHTRENLQPFEIIKVGCLLGLTNSKKTQTFRTFLPVFHIKNSKSSKRWKWKLMEKWLISTDSQDFTRILASSQPASRNSKISLA